MQENHSPKDDNVPREENQNFREKEDPNNLEDSRPQEEDPKLGFEPQEENKKIFVKNLPYSTTDEQFREFFSKFGDIVKAEIRKRQDGSSKGVGFVEFSNMDDKKKAMEARSEDLTIGERILDVREARADTGLDSRTIFIGNISYKTTGEMLKKFFLDTCPEIKGDFKINIKSNNRGGYAYVEFDNEEDIEQALKLNGKKLEDRELRVEMKKPPNDRRGGFRGRPYPGGMRGRRGGYGHHDYGRIRERERERYGNRYGGDRYRDRDRDRDHEMNYRDNRERSRENQRSWSRDRSRDRERRREREERDERDRERRDRGRDRDRMDRDRRNMHA